MCTTWSTSCLLYTSSQGAGQGFAHLRPQYIDFENPFKEGTYRAIETIKKGNASTAEWIPEIPSTGQYAVYAVSYTHLDVYKRQGLPKNEDDIALFHAHAYRLAVKCYQPLLLSLIHIS